jgi:cobalamin biosynthesis protein CobT
MAARPKSRKQEPEEELEEEEQEEASDSDDEESAEEEDEGDVEEDVEEEEDEGEEEEEDEEEAPPPSEKSTPSAASADKPKRGRPKKSDTPRPSLTKQQKVALFQQLEERQKLVKEIEEHLETAKAEKAAAAFEIYDKIGTGPFKWKGAIIKLFKSKKSENAAYVRMLADVAQDIG